MADTVEKVGSRNFIARNGSFGIRRSPALNQSCGLAAVIASKLPAFREGRLFQQYRPFADGPLSRTGSVE